ncbi:F0F1 ATP synthase subunit delta [Sphingomicrobium marinum]|uniref:F0F1 ATP synthase subunit delta n=1 Tax=Sphingomicrobium marinum TaxID=1227950 RepID=UPI0022403606|nr:F0F1 ATP synthase subunit delta [Sphingomicrobium marinum]
MSESGGIRASLAGRYASALFGLAKDENKVDTVAGDMESLGAAFAESDDLKTLAGDPSIGRADAARAVRAIADQSKFDRLTKNFLGVLAENGRLDQLEATLNAFAQLYADHKNVAHAQVTSARPLTDAQVATLKDKLSARASRTVSLDTQVDPELLGGIRIQMGSELIDASVKTKLNSLAQAMKG